MRDGRLTMCQSPWYLPLRCQAMCQSPWYLPLRCQAMCQSPWNLYQKCQAYYVSVTVVRTFDMPGYVSVTVSTYRRNVRLTNCVSHHGKYLWDGRLCVSPPGTYLWDGRPSQCSVYVHEASHVCPCSHTYSVIVKAVFPSQHAYTITSLLLQLASYSAAAAAAVAVI